MVKHTIKLKNHSNIVEELVAAAAITPGHLVELIAAGTVQKHSTAGGNAIPMFACEDGMQGKTIDQDYAATDPVQVWIPMRGDIVNALLKDGETVVIGDFVESGGDGTVVKHETDSAGVGTLGLQIVGQVVLAVDLSGSSGTHPESGLRVQIRIV